MIDSRVATDESVLSPALSVRNDVIAAAVALGAIAIFVVTGSQALAGVEQPFDSAGGGSDRIAVIALFINVALILFAWRRYKDIRALMMERAAAERRVKALASHDQLTGLLIRSSLIDSCEELLPSLKAAGKSLAMIVLDLEQFKKVNDVYGHLAGDLVLRSVATVITEVAPAGALCARIGGNEFAVALPFEEQDRDSVRAFAATLGEKLVSPFDISGIQVHVGSSIGLAALARDCANSEALLRRADIATAVAKGDPSHQIVWFDNSMESVLRARNEVENGLRRGIPLAEFVPFYQPQVELATGRICGFEALARWAHPTGGYVDPDIFIPVAEEAGLIGDLFQSLFQQALSDALNWDTSITLSVNISSAQLKDPLLAHKILQMLSKSGFPASRLEIEITETCLFENLATAQAIVSSLKNHGIMLSLDDFGTGYSSLSHLRALPFDRIKIDRSFVESMNKDPESFAIVRAVAMMGDSLGVAVTGEGIEDAETAVRLRSIGCDRGQGWLYGRPLSAEHVHGLLGEMDLLSYRAAWVEAAEKLAAPNTRLRPRSAA